MRKLAFLAFLSIGNMLAATLGEAHSQSSTPPAKTTEQAQFQTEIERAAAERDRLMKEQKFEAALPFARRIVEILRTHKPNTVDLVIALDQWARIGFSLDDFELARRLWLEAHSILSAKSPDSPALSWLLNNLGLTEYSLGNLAEAERWFEKSLAIKELKNKGSIDVARTLNNLGLIAHERGNLVMAAVRFRSALAIFGDFDRESAACQVNLGMVLADAGNIVEAVMILSDTLDHFSASSQERADSLNNLGTLHFRLGDLDQAKNCFDQARRIYSLRGTDTLGEARSVMNLASVVRLSGNLKQSHSLLNYGIEIFKRRGVSANAFALALINLGHLDRDLGDPTSAMRHYEAALQILNSYATPSLDVALVRDSLGNLAWDRGDSREAMRQYETAHSIIKLRAPVSVDMLDSHLKVGMIARTQGNFSRVLESIENSGALAESLLNTQGIVIAQDLGTFGTRISNTLRSIGWLSEPEKSYVWLPTLRAVGLSLQIRAKAMERAAIRDESVRIAVSEAQLASRSESKWATSTTPKDMSVSDWQEQLLRLRSKRILAERFLNDLMRKKVGLASEPLRIDLADIQKKIPPKAALIEFLRISSWDEQAERPGLETYSAFIIQNVGPVRFVRLGNADDIDKLVREFMVRVNVDSSADRAVAVGNAPLQGKSKSRVELGKELFRRLMAPLGNLPTRLQIAPDGSLHGLAFDALQDSLGKYLLETKSISIVGSGRDLAVQPPTAAATNPIVFGVGSFDSDLVAHGRSVSSLAPIPHAPAGFRRMTRAGSSWGNLPGAVEEARAVASILRVEPILNGKAVEERLLRIKNPRVLHLATHGFSFPPAVEVPERDQMESMSAGERFASADNPMLRSGIVLAGANNEAKLTAAGYQDGWVTALDLSLLDLRGTELVVVSACNTGLGDVRQCEGVFGLQRALRFAGAHTLIVSLFEVPDASTVTLMRDFYGAWKPGSPVGTKQAALRTAKLKLLRDPKTRSPKHWAGLVLLGDR